MKKLHKIIIFLFFIIVITAIIFFIKDFVIRQYFINKLKNHNYNEYILYTNCNNKKVSISYYTTNYMYQREYNENGELSNKIIIYDYDKNIAYAYDLTNCTTTNIPFDFSKALNLNNNRLLDLLNNTNSSTFSYKGSTTINNRNCYLFEFKCLDKNIYTIYLDKKLLYTILLDRYNPEFNDVIDDTINQHMIYDFTIDLDLKEKNLFEFNIK